MKRKYNEGFTLVELMVAIMIASIVTLAATSVLLLGVRLNRNSSDTAQRQNTTRIFLSVMEKLATEGSITKITDEPDRWSVAGESGKILFYYVAKEGKIFTGGELSDGVCSGGTPMMEDVIASHITMDNALLTVSVETADGSYTTSAYCRTADVQMTVGGPNVDNAESELNTAPAEVVGKATRKELLQILFSQRGSTGMILVEGPDNKMYKTPVYYAQWYEKKWASDTPWCVCFLSWGLNQVSDKIEDASLVNVNRAADNGDYLWFASVDKFMNFFKNLDENGKPFDSQHGHRWQDSDYTPAPGDIVFIDWTGTKTDPAHVGIVLTVDDRYIYTIEGNTANMVAVRKYARADKLIMGYGVIDWKADPEENTESANVS